MFKQKNNRMREKMMLPRQRLRHTSTGHHLQEDPLDDRSHLGVQVGLNWQIASPISTFFSALRVLFRSRLKLVHLMSFVVSITIFGSIEILDVMSMQRSVADSVMVSQKYAFEPSGSMRSSAYDSSGSGGSSQPSTKMWSIFQIPTSTTTPARKMNADGLEISLGIYKYVEDDHQNQNNSEDSSHSIGPNLHTNQLNTSDAYEDDYEMNARDSRFPSVSERVRLYMSTWFVPPCPENRQGFVLYRQGKRSEYLVREISRAGKTRRSPRTFSLDNDVSSQAVFHLDRLKLVNCSHEYCSDTIKYILPAIDRVGTKDENTDIVSIEERNEFGSIINPTNTSNRTSYPLPFLLRFGDHEHSKALLENGNSYGLDPLLPIIRKFRRALRPEDIQALTTGKCKRFSQNLPSRSKLIQPIVWFLKTDRHYGMLHLIRQEDISWSDKRDMAIFRGGLTGVYRHGLTANQLGRGVEGFAVCNLIPRCKLVYQSDKSKIVDAKLTPSWRRDKAKTKIIGKKLDVIPPKIDDIQMYTEKMSRRNLLQYKAIIMLEGNDVSSGLKWALLSNSVVMMPRPTMTSWVMEELLIPWRHYIPLEQDLSDIEEKVMWMISHDAEAKEISKGGSLWMKDLMFHPSAEDDQQKIFDVMIQRYKAHFLAS